MEILWELLLDDRHDVVFAHHEQILAVDLHFGTGVLAEQDLVALLDVERADLAVLEDLALTDGDHFAADRLLGGRVRDHDSARGFAFLFGTPDHDTVMQGTKLHGGTPSSSLWFNIKD